MAQQSGASNLDTNFVQISDVEVPLYYFGRLVWEGMANFADIENWKYSMDQLNMLHEILDFKAKLSGEQNGQDSY